MKYIITVEHYFQGSGYSHEEDMECGKTDKVFEASKWAEEGIDRVHDIERNEWLEVKASFYADDADPMFDDALETTNCIVDRDDSPVIFAAAKKLDLEIL